MVLPGFRREIYCAVEGLDNAARARVIASKITREKLNSAMAKFVDRKGERVEKMLLDLRREIYTAITGIDLAHAPDYHIQMEKLRWLMAVRSKAAEHGVGKVGSWFIEAVEAERARVEKVEDIRKARRWLERTTFRDLDLSASKEVFKTEDPKPEFKIRMHFTKNKFIEDELTDQDSVGSPEERTKIYLPENRDSYELSISTGEYDDTWRDHEGNSKASLQNMMQDDQDVDEFSISPMEEHYVQSKSSPGDSSSSSALDVPKFESMDPAEKQKTETISASADSTPSTTTEIEKFDSMNPVEEQKAESIPTSADSPPSATFGIRKFESGNPREQVSSSRFNILPATSTPLSAMPQIPTHLPHLTSDGSAHMVNVTDKDSTHRVAVAIGYVHFSEPETYQLIQDNLLKKGDVLGTARIAGIMAAKNCPALVPLCHPIALSGVAVDAKLLDGPQMSSSMSNDQGDGGALSRNDLRRMGPSLHGLLSRALDFQRQHTNRLEATIAQCLRLDQEITDFLKSIESFIALRHYRSQEEKIKELEAKKEAMAKGKIRGRAIKIPVKNSLPLGKRLQKIDRFEMNAKSLRRIYRTEMQEIAARLKAIEGHTAKGNESLSKLANVAIEINGLISSPPEGEDGEFKDRMWKPESYGAVRIEAKVECVGPTGVEMEALTSVSAAALTVIDMIKAVDRNARVDGVKMVMKMGGKSGSHVDKKWASDPHRAYDAN
jgi:molybdenum cofactor biosynthesis enzyme